MIRGLEKFLEAGLRSREPARGKWVRSNKSLIRCTATRSRAFGTPAALGEEHQGVEGNRGQHPVRKLVTRQRGIRDCWMPGKLEAVPRGGLTGGVRRMICPPALITGVVTAGGHDRSEFQERGSLYRSRTTLSSICSSEDRTSAGCSRDRPLDCPGDESVGIRRQGGERRRSMTPGTESGPGVHAQGRGWTTSRSR